LPEKKKASMPTANNEIDYFVTQDKNQINLTVRKITNIKDIE
jgi:hypothetical protein